MRFDALDGLRGVSALCVVVHHLNVVNGFTEWTFFANSYLFVELFFVLSGFVIAHGYAYRQQFRVSRFWLARTFRLWPLHATMLGVVLAIELAKLWAYHRGIDFNNPPFTGRNDYSQILPNLFLVQTWQPQFDSLSFNFPAWSISVEYYIYLMFAVTLLLPSKLRVWLWALVAVLMMYWLLTTHRSLPHSVNRGGLCFFSGALAYAAYRYVATWFSQRKRLLPWLELVVVALAIGLMSRVDQEKTVAAYWVFVFCLVVLVLSFEGGSVSRLLKTPFFARLGQLSYSIYLTHYSVILIVTSTFLVAEKWLGLGFTKMLEEQRYFDFGALLINNLFAVLMLVGVLLFSAVTYRWVEMPGMRLGKRIAAKLDQRQVQ
jgi:peptidoglycan/LPS O-acetylase OafA/YrhL